MLPPGAQQVFLLWLQDSVASAQEQGQKQVAELDAKRKTDMATLQEHLA